MSEIAERICGGYVVGNQILSEPDRKILIEKNAHPASAPNPGSTAVSTRDVTQTADYLLWSLTPSKEKLLTPKGGASRRLFLVCERAVFRRKVILAAPRPAWFELHELVFRAE